MKTKLFILTFAVLLIYAGYVSADEGMNQSKGSMMENKNKSESTSKAVEVGNKICPVSGDKIPAPGEKGTMGDEPVKYEYNGKIYNLCCPMCIKDFKKNPKKYSKIAEDEVAKEKKMKEGKSK